MSAVNIVPEKTVELNRRFADHRSMDEYRVRFDADGVVVGESLDPSLGRRLGIALEGETGVSIHEFAQRLASLAEELPGRVERRLRRMLDEETEFLLHGDCRTPAGDCHLHISGRIVRDFSGGVLYALVFVDATQSARLQRLYEQMFRLANHELKSPIACILGATEYAQDHVESGSIEGVNVCLDMILRNATAMQDMIERYLTLSRLESGMVRAQPIEMRLSSDVLNGLVNQLQPELLKRGMSVRFELEGVSREPTLHADPELLSVVVRNLLTNALNYGHANTEIVVRLTVRDEQSEIAVENTGPGIPEEDLDKLFRRFVRLDGARHVRGSGLGLYNARKTVESWGGRISAESAGGVTRFGFTVPGG